MRQYKPSAVETLESKFFLTSMSMGAIIAAPAVSAATTQVRVDYGSGGVVCANVHIIKSDPLPNPEPPPGPDPGDNPPIVYPILPPSGPSGPGS
jgi:hypothetical protein